MQITKVALAGMALVCALCPALYGVELLTNRGFENANHSLAWTVVAPLNVTQYPGAFNAAGQPPGTSGPWGLHIVNNGGGFSQGSAKQEVTVLPGLYDINASVWARAFDNSVDTLWSRVRFRVLVDGSVYGGNADLYGPYNTTGAGWSDWTLLTRSLLSVPVTSKIGVEVVMRAHGNGGPDWGEAVADVFRLDAVMIPEPAGLLLLALGSVVLLPRRARRS